MELRATSEMMQSEDYKERFRAEYYQTKIRLKRLYAFVDKYEKDMLDFHPLCPLPLLRKQLKHMEDYLIILERRAVIEGIDIN